jgi:hypothetical protein
MRTRKIVLFLLFFSLIPLLAVALPALAGDPEGSHLPRGPKDLPSEAAPRAHKPFIERFVPVERIHDGEDAGGAFGWIGASLGDLDGDGRNAYLIAAPYYESFTGRVVVFDDDGSEVAAPQGAPFSLFGYSAGEAGDVNGDGVSDYIVGAPRAFSLAFRAPGRAVVYSGADHSIIHDLSGAPRFGTAVTGIGDANGDGYDDFAVGTETYGYTPGQAFSGTGRVDVYSGQSGQPLWSRNGFHDGDLLGGGAGRVDDLDGDGRDDLVVAAWGADAFNGRAYVFSAADGSLIYELAPSEPGGFGTFGQFFASGAGDINADGVGDIFIGDYFAFNGEGRAYVYSGADGSILHVFRPETAADGGVGPGRGIPDINGDGHDDLIIAAYRSSEGANLAGKVYVYSGADGSILHEVTGVVASDLLGVDALSLGDLDGDGGQEYLLTAPGLSFGGMDVGHNYVISFNTPPGVLPGR